MVNLLGADSGKTQEELDATRGSYAIFSYLDNMYKSNMVAIVKDEGDDKQILFHIKVILHRFRADPRVQLGGACLVYLYSKIGEASLWTKKIDDWKLHTI